MDNYRDIFRFVVELTDSKAMSAAYFVLVSTCITAHTHFHRRRYLQIENNDVNNTQENESFSPIPNYDLPVSTIKIYYLDGCHISLDVNDSTTMKEICTHICLELKLGLYEVQEELCALNEQKLLPTSMTIGELIQRWKLLQWPDAKLVAPVYLQEWAYRATSKAIRRVRFENSYLTHSYYNSSLEDRNSPSSSPSRSPNRDRRRRRQLKLNNIDENLSESSNNNSTNNSRSSTPNRSEPTTPTKNSPNQSFNSISNRARERTHALLNTLFVSLPEDTNRRHLSTTARDRSWENSLRRRSPLRGRLGQSPSTNGNYATANTTTTAGNNNTSTTANTTAGPSSHSNTTSPSVSIHTTPHATIRSGVNITPSSVERRNQSILPSPDTIHTRSQSHHHTTSSTTNSHTSSTEHGAYIETPDKVRPNTTYVRLSNDNTHSRSASPNITNSQYPYTTEGNNPTVMDMGQGESPTTTSSTVSAATVIAMNTAAAADGVVLNTTNGNTTTATNSNSNNTTTTYSPSVLSVIQHNSSVDPNIHIENARTNALLHRLFDSMRDNIDETCTPKPLTTDDEATTPHSRIHSNSNTNNGMSHSSELSRSISPTCSVGSGSSSISSGGHRYTRRRTTPASRSPRVRPPFDASTSAPTLSMLLALGQSVPDVKSPHIVLEKEDVVQHSSRSPPEGIGRWRRSLASLPPASSDDESPARSRNSLRTPGSNRASVRVSPSSTTGITSNSTTPTGIPVRTRLFSRRTHTSESVPTTTSTTTSTYKGSRRALGASPLPANGTPVRSIRTPTTTGTSTAGTQSRSQLKSPTPRSTHSSLYSQPEHPHGSSVAEALDCIELRISRDSMDGDHQQGGISPGAAVSVSGASRTGSPSSAASHSDYASTARRYGRNGHRHPHNTSANSIDTTQNNRNSSNKKKNIAFMRRASTATGTLSGDESSTSGIGRGRSASPYIKIPNTTTTQRRESKRPLNWIP